jgi:hypothetical protein
MKEKLINFALRSEVQILTGFIIVVSVGYYMWLKKKKEKFHPEVK